MSASVAVFPPVAQRLRGFFSTFGTPLDTVDGTPPVAALPLPSPGARGFTLALPAPIHGLPVSSPSLRRRVRTPTCGYGSPGGGVEGAVPRKASGQVARPFADCSRLPPVPTPHPGVDIDGLVVERVQPCDVIRTRSRVGHGRRPTGTLTAGEDRSVFLHPPVCGDVCVATLAAACSLQCVCGGVMVS